MLHGGSGGAGRGDRVSLLCMYLATAGGEAAGPKPWSAPRTQLAASGNSNTNNSGLKNDRFNSTCLIAAASMGGESVK